MSPLETFKNQHPVSHIRLIAGILTVAAIAWLGHALSHTLSCFLLSFVIAYLLDPIVVRLENRLFKRIHAIALLYVVLGIISTFSLAFLLPMLTISWDSFLHNLPQQLQQIKQALLSWQSTLPTRYGSEEIAWLLDNLIGNADSMVEKAGIWAYGFATRMFFNVFNLILAPILVFFMLNYKRKIMETTALWLPASRRDLILHIGREIDSSVGGYLRGQVMVSIVLALATIPTLIWLGIPHPILCGIFAGAASILPFVGVILAMLPPLLFAWLTYGTGAIIIKVLIAFGIIYFLEGYLVKPLVFKESMNLNPLLTIIMVMAFGELIGFWGILLALPITAAMIITSQHWLKGDFANPENEP
jgi:putative permease